MLDTPEGNAVNVMEAPPPNTTPADGAADAAPIPSPAAANPSPPPPSPSSPTTSRPALVRRSSTAGSAESKGTTAPAPPRWRFVKEAKSTLGYSSLHAGSYIRGMSSDELGAKYVAPDVTLYKPQREAVEVERQPVYQLPSKKKAEEDVEVGKLDVRGESVESDEFVGSIAGLARNEAAPNGPRDPYKEWAVNMPLSSKPEREGEWRDGEYTPSFDDNVEDFNPYRQPMDYTLPDEETSVNSPHCVGRLQFHDRPENDDVFVVEIPRGKKKVQGEGQDLNDGNGIGHYVDDSDEFAKFAAEFPLDEENAFQAQDESQGDEEDTFQEDVGGDPRGNDGALDEIDPSDSKDEDDDEDNKKKRRCCCLLLPCLLILLAGILGGVFGRKKVQEPTEGTKGIVLPPPILIVNDTAVPSSAPSSECPLGTSPLTVERAQSSSTSEGRTWRVRDACSGDLIAQCLPCPTELTSLFETRAVEPANKFVGRQRMTQCLPANGEYVMEIVATEDSSEECCGFDYNAMITYDNAPLNTMNGVGGLFDDASSGMYFGTRDVPCPSSMPSSMPSVQSSSEPSLRPSHAPSLEPSSPPSLEPTSSPTRSPVVFMGACGTYFEAGASYSLGAKVTAENFVYECTAVPCGSFWFGLGDMGDSLRSQGWTAIGSCLGTRPPTESPTLSPSSGPTKSPSLSPSLRPTPPPTLSPSLPPTPPPTAAPTTLQPTDQPTDPPTLSPTCSEPEFNLCFAIDMSGSVCPGSDNGCKDFEEVQEFTIELLDELDSLPEESSYSLVQFATDGDLVSGLSTAEVTALEIDGLKYSAGATNTAEAIELCQQSLLASTLERKNFIMMITDGEPTEPGDRDKATELAEEAATSAKAGGTTIIPIFISKAKDFEKEALAFMERISSDGTFFDVTGFDSLSTLQEVLINEVSCGSVGEG